MHGPTCIVWANLTPFSLSGVCFAALNTVNGQLSAVFTGDDVERLGVSAVYAAADGLDRLRLWAAETGIEQGSNKIVQPLVMAR
jgi:hypothetical protein